jgi:hypothetical protein
MRNRTGMLLSEKQGCGPVKTGKNRRDIREKSGFPALLFPDTCRQFFGSRA